METFVPIFAALIAFLIVQPAFWLVKHGRQPVRSRIHDRADKVSDDRC